ncbi:predicted protein [Histoplasma capsulatum G186AR]|uniref:Uncharacterized protein n=1 Tax=Ajellomyces capsulatus (strain G186AR / H82 / ATCC MYA-2454 / RMSCC 2432) TaxID=447093 RepID=C0NDL7_AJECG|nr:uncharacterized protein HCBG_01960 [Histoplasma capsulatum G186AR]EEH10315.1 predicted protein [Histoplasma capsulatum G186AR]
MSPAYEVEENPEPLKHNIHNLRKVCRVTASGPDCKALQRTTHEYVVVSFANAPVHYVTLTCKAKSKWGKFKALSPSAVGIKAQQLKKAYKESVPPLQILPGTTTEQVKVESDPLTCNQRNIHRSFKSWSFPLSDPTHCSAKNEVSVCTLPPPGSCCAQHPDEIKKQFIHAPSVDHPRMAKVARVAISNGLNM